MKYTFESGFAPHIMGLIQQKRADGFKYDCEEWHLKKFDEFCASKFPGINEVTRELAAEWAVIRPTEGKNFRRRRVVMLRQLSLYILSLGLESYVPRNTASVEKPVLYIPSQEEMIRFFNELETWENAIAKKMSCRGKYEVIFHLYYCCGLRLSEARLLKYEHLDLIKGTLTILESKGRKDRLVYLPPDGIELLTEYLQIREKEAPDSPWLFPGDNPDNPMTPNPIQRAFKKCWAQLPFAGDTDKHPSVHCLRHAFVVERLNDWMKQDVNLQEMLPYLSKYLGHASPSETFYYYHLVKKAFAVVKQKDAVAVRVIPEVMPYEEY